MTLLVRRYITAEQRKRDEYGVTEDDIMEVRQDVSSLRYELINILKQNGMKTPRLAKDEPVCKYMLQGDLTTCVLTQRSRFSHS